MRKPNTDNEEFAESSFRRLSPDEYRLGELTALYVYKLKALIKRGVITNLDPADLDKVKTIAQENILQKSALR